MDETEGDPALRPPSTDTNQGEAGVTNMRERETETTARDASARHLRISTDTFPGRMLGHNRQQLIHSMIPSSFLIKLGSRTSASGGE
jgi:hypothetical protein